MNFTRMSDWHEISDCGAYVVSAASVKGRFKFQAWKLAAQSGKTASLLGTFDDAEPARELCRQHTKPAEAA